MATGSGEKLACLQRIIWLKSQRARLTHGNVAARREKNRKSETSVAGPLQRGQISWLCQSNGIINPGHQSTVDTWR
jgi:hypothetical protein